MIEKRMFLNLIKCSQGQKESTLQVKKCFRVREMFIHELKKLRGSKLSMLTCSKFFAYAQSVF